MIIHIVKRGDSIYKIAQEYNVPYRKVISDNQLTNPNKLVVGQTIVVMNDMNYQTVLPGQTLYTIAMLYGLTPAELLKVNPQISNVLQPGQIVNIPANGKLGNFKVNGYAYPGLSSAILATSLPYLTYLSIFSYQARSDGSLNAIDDSAMIAQALRAGVAPKMVVTNIEEGESFSSDLASSILNSESYSDRLIDEILQTLQTKKYYGVDIDFEYLYPSDREAYNHFLLKAGERIRARGYEVSTAVAPKLSADQQGLLYEAHDYAAHGQYVDEVILMTYEWGYLYGPPMAVAPIDQVEKVLSYAVKEIPPYKILMGMPNYGYDWTLPYEQGTAARTINNVQALDLAYEVGAEIKYDQKSQSPYFTYYDGEQKEHIVWFEDARSVEAKVRLAASFLLGGISYWTVNHPFPQNWLVVESLVNVEKVIR